MKKFFATLCILAFVGATLVFLVRQRMLSRLERVSPGAVIELYGARVTFSSVTRPKIVASFPPYARLDGVTLESPYLGDPIVLNDVRVYPGILSKKLDVRAPDFKSNGGSVDWKDLELHFKNKKLEKVEAAGVLVAAAVKRPEIVLTHPEIVYRTSENRLPDQASLTFQDVTLRSAQNPLFASQSTLKNVVFAFHSTPQGANRSARWDFSSDGGDLKVGGMTGTIKPWKAEAHARFADLSLQEIKEAIAAISALGADGQKSETSLLLQLQSLAGRLKMRFEMLNFSWEGLNLAEAEKNTISMQPMKMRYEYRYGENDYSAQVSGRWGGGAFKTPLGEGTFGVTTIETQAQYLIAQERLAERAMGYYAKLLNRAPEAPGAETKPSEVASLLRGVLMAYPDKASGEFLFEGAHLKSPLLGAFDDPRWTMTTSIGEQGGKIEMMTGPIGMTLPMSPDKNIQQGKVEIKLTWAAPWSALLAAARSDAVDPLAALQNQAVALEVSGVVDPGINYASYEFSGKFSSSDLEALPQKGEASFEVKIGRASKSTLFSPSPEMVWDKEADLATIKAELKDGAVYVNGKKDDAYSASLQELTKTMKLEAESQPQL